MLDPLAQCLRTKPFLVLDAAMATELEGRGHDLDDPLWSARILIDAPDAIKAVHRSYIDAGADIITTASYQASVPGLLARGLSESAAIEVLRRATAVALEARSEAKADVLVAASLGPYGAYLADGSEYRGRYAVSARALADFHRARVQVVETSAQAPDLLAFETIPDLDEARAIATILREPGIGAWVSFSLRDASTLADGRPLSQALEALTGVERLVGVGVNCCDPAMVAGAISELAATSQVPVLAYPNSGEGWDAAAHQWQGSGSDAACIAAHAQAWIDAGASVLGGCCRTGPALTRRLATLASG